MRLKTAMAVLRKDAGFLGMSLSDLLAMIEKNPLSFPNKVIKAFEVYKKEAA